MRFKDFAKRFLPIEHPRAIPGAARRRPNSNLQAGMRFQVRNRYTDRIATYTARSVFNDGTVVTRTGYRFNRDSILRVLG